MSVIIGVPTPVHVTMFIDGRSEDARSTFEVRDPGRVRDVVALVGASTPDDVHRAVLAAAKAGQTWAETPLARRLSMLDSAADVLEALGESLAELLARENGALLREAATDVARGIALFRRMLETAETYLQPRVVEDETQWLSLEKVPVGVTALLVPWNSPMVLTMAKLAPALAAGNTVVLKPSPLAPAALSRALETIASFLPTGVVNVIHGDADVGSALTTHPGVRKTSFTGSVEVGRMVLAAAASTVKRVSLELGGNDAAVVLDDADVAELMPRLCQGAFTRAGQICFAVKRVYVPQSRYDEFFRTMCEVVESYRVGHGLDGRSTFGPLISGRQRDYVNGLVERSRREGAGVYELGEPVDPGSWDDGWYTRPVVVRDIAPDAELVTCEQFGPVLPLVPYRAVDDAVRMANASEFGLASSVWSADVERALGVARRLQAGATFLNSHNLWSMSLDMPLGGVKQSGLGRERTALGIQEYVEEHAIRLVKQH